MKNLEVGKFYYRVEVNQYLIADIQKIKLTKETYPGNFKYKVIEQTLNRLHELPETDEERIKKKFGTYSDYSNGRIISTILGGQASFKPEDLFEEITNDYVLEKILAKKAQLQEAKKHALYCPITGGELICIGSDRDVMDGAIKWTVLGHEDIIWETGSRWFSGIFDHPTYGYYKWYPETKEWRKQIRYGDGWKFIDEPRNAEEEENLKKALAEYEEEVRKRKEEQEEYQRKVASGEIEPGPLFPTIKRVTAQVTSFEQVEVKPLSPPSGQLFYIDSPFDYEDEDDKKEN